MVDPARLRDLYSGYSDDELQRIWRTDLVAEARVVLQDELRQRGIAVPPLPQDAGEAEAKPKPRRFSNPYLPPGALIADPKEAVVLSARGLVRLFQLLVIATVLITILLWISVFVPWPVSEQARLMRDATGFDGLNPAASWFVVVALDIVWLVGALGLCFFKWWARWLCVAIWIASLLNTLVGGTGVFFAWELILYDIGILMNGAIFVLAFLPPLSRYFEEDWKT